MKPLFAIASLVAAASLASGAGAQTAYPTKPITIVVPYAAGGVSDALARSLAQRLSTALKQQVLVDNRGGGNTVIGAQAVAKAPADGYTLLLTAEATLAMNPHLYAKLPYDPQKSFAPIAALGQTPQSLIVASAVPAASLQQFVGLARQQPGKLTYATLGVGSTAHLNFALFEKAAGVKLIDVSYKGAAPALTDLMGGHVSAMVIATGLVSQQVKAGKVKALAVAGAKRSKQLPEVPTFAEAGLPGFAPASWFALLAPAGTPAEIVKLLNGETNKVLHDASFAAEFADEYGIEALSGSPEDLATLIKSETQRWGAVIRDAGIKLD
jgi:tripartite-type tricarboxylate transporter receptor subunit TctC